MRLATTPSRAPRASFSQSSATERSRVQGESLSSFRLPRFLVKGFECGATLAERRFDQALAFRVEQHVEQNEESGGLLGELLDPGLGGMNAHLQSIEGKRIADRYGELSIEHERRSAEGDAASLRPRESSARAACLILP